MLDLFSCTLCGPQRPNGLPAKAMADDISSTFSTSSKDEKVKDGEGRIRRSLKYHPPESLHVTVEGREVENVFQVLEFNSQKFAGRPLLGTRLKKTAPDGSPLLGQYVFMSYADVHRIATNIGKGLRSLGLQKGAKVAVFSNNRPEWTLSMFAIWSQGFVVVPVQALLNADCASHVINHSDAEAIIVAPDRLPVLQSFALQIPNIKAVVVMGEPPVDVPDHLHFYSIREVEALGETYPGDLDLSSSDDLAYIMYTSGTTGTSKGVMLSHYNIVKGLAGLCIDIPDVTSSDVFLSHMPLAHMLETKYHLRMILSGTPIGFFSGNPRELLSDILALRPTILIGVPRIHQRIFDELHKKVSELSSYKRSIFSTAFNQQLKEVHRGRRIQFLDKMIFNDIAQAVGGRIRMIFSGGAPLLPKHWEFLRVCLPNCTVRQLYGLTESGVDPVAICPENYLGVNAVGAPGAANEIKLVDVPELEYTNDDRTADNQPCPRGEVWVRSPCAFLGYYKSPSQTAEMLEVGWLKTGDIGRWNHDGTLSIIDRKKNIFKLAQGLYLAPEALERIYGQSSLVNQLWVYGSGYATAPIAIVVPKIDQLRTIAASAGVKDQDVATLCQSPVVRKAVCDQLLALGKQSDLKHFEYVKNVFLEWNVNADGAAWTTENGMLTPTMKVKRKELLHKYYKTIMGLYAEIGDELPAEE